MIARHAFARSHRAPTPRMHSLSRRAFRLARLSLQIPHPTTRSSRRSFHASAVARATDDSGGSGGGSGSGSGSGSAEPRDDGNKPEKEDQNGENNTTGENLFGETNATVNEESHGRKKPGSGSLRSRTLRNRKAEELPPVQLPKSFIPSALYRYEDGKKPMGSNPVDTNKLRESVEAVLFEDDQFRIWDDPGDSLLGATALTEESVREAINTLASDSVSGEAILERGRQMVALSFWATALLTREAYGKDAVKKLLENSSIHSSSDMYPALHYTKVLAGNDVLGTLRGIYPIPRDTTNKPTPSEGAVVKWIEEELFEYVVASVNADLQIKAPKNVKLADLRRPVTIINTPGYSGFSIGRDLVRHIGASLEADVLHIRAPDIARIVGGYLLQDAMRAPGAISQLGYKAAESSGRSIQTNLMTSDEGETYDGFRLLRDDRLKKDNKKSISLMDDFLNGPTRGKNDDLWEDLKINAALEEIIHTADSKSTEQRPLLVHLDDFVALNTDLECGAMIVGKIRKLIDRLWAEERKIVLIGTCSSKDAPKPYISALTELELTERVMNIRLVPDHAPLLVPKELASFETRLETWERTDYLRENEANIVQTLASMVDLPPDSTVATTGEIGISQIDEKKLPRPWLTSILPLAEVYHIATAMIGYSKSPMDVFNIQSAEKVAVVIGSLERLSDNHSGDKSSKNTRRELKEFLDGRRYGPDEENHEKSLESGLVNAEDIRTTFKDVHAPPETIESVKMLTTLSLIRPEAFSYGVLSTDRIPGCLLYGPPGTGKTLLAKAVAKESGANMIEISGASINNKFVGESEKNVRALFRLAKKREPLVIFIDEADALLGARGRGDLLSRRETINQFLREWDGMEKMKAFIMVATNRPFDLDEAVLRRLPRKLLIDLPTEADRAAILRIHLKGEILDEATVSIEDIAKRTPLYSGSDLKNVCVAAAMAAVKEELDMEQQQEKLQQQQQQKQGNDTATDTPKRRILRERHFGKALQEIGASVSEDMETLTAIRKFDEKYGDGGPARRRKRKGMGFGVLADARDGDARVRSGR
ncbi:AAA-domain-containing protein [Hypoxylon fragiforme]|uniref:AAA-domain-containing protein n=1 Tax=Hypoxylon fragiforme TaxID=63214 RepID=UPI0020C7114C|nr:AAA-domain-containing protein [Hypoxylon fragiforme]KAI2611679.1 AAA-domain-containing protein [Hypoxylon fragiforme]